VLSTPDNEFTILVGHPSLHFNEPRLQYHLLAGDVPGGRLSFDSKVVLTNDI